MENDSGVPGGVDVGDFFRSVEFEHGLALVFVGLNAAFDGFVFGIVPAVFLERAFAQAAVEFLTIGATEVEDVDDVDVLLHDLGLLDIARDAVEDEEVDVGLEEVALGFTVDVGFPELDGEFVGDEFAAAGVVHELLAKDCAGIEGTKDFAAGTMNEARDAPEDGALGAFAAAGCSKHKDGLVSGGCVGAHVWMGIGGS